MQLSKKESAGKGRIPTPALLWIQLVLFTEDAGFEKHNSHLQQGKHQNRAGPLPLLGPRLPISAQWSASAAVPCYALM